MVSSSFTAAHRYGVQGEIYCDDGRELSLLKSIFSLPAPSLAALRNNPPAILAAIDQFATSSYLMNVGELKGRHVTSLLATHKPKVSLELGGYVGYSAILFGAAVKKAVGPKARYYCLEHNPVFAAIIMTLVDLAGLSDVVKVPSFPICTVAGG
jgi:catechol O-methyltransferase